MERRVAKKLDSHFTEFKNDIKNWFQENTCEIIGDSNKSAFLQYIFDYDNVSLSKEDFQKRKRIKNVVPQYDRCCAYRANNEQCTRRKKDDSNYCGTHIKGTPHGTVSSTDVTDVKIKKKQIWAEEIKGICYYIDDTKNIYDHEDIIKNKENPKIIANYKVDFEGKYSIPEYGI
jgi:hypothetical protein